MRTAHLLPSLFSFLALAGTYRLGRDIGGRSMGVLSGIALLVSPLFLSQAFRALPISAAMAGAVWSLLFHRREKYLVASLMCALAVMMREQALVLVPVYIITDIYFSRRFNWMRTLVFCIPILVIVIHGLLNWIFNGFIFEPINSPGIDAPFSPVEFIKRLRHFGNYMLAAQMRWLPVGFGVGILYSRLFSWRIGLIPVALLCGIGAAGFLQAYYLPILVLLILYPVLLKRDVVPRTALVLGLFVAAMILFFTMIVFVTATTMQYLFYRYLAPAYPALIILMLWPFFNSGRRYLPVAIAFVVGMALVNFDARNEPVHCDSTLAGYCYPLLVTRDAARWIEIQDYPVIGTGGVINLFSDPSYGYALHGVPVTGISDRSAIVPHQDYILVVPPFFPWGEDGKAAMDRFSVDMLSRYDLRHCRSFTRGPFSTTCFYMIWDPPDSIDEPIK